MKKIAIVLSGCGVYDGAEIHESVSTMLAASKHGVLYQMFAPDMDQLHVINHLSGDVMDEKRNVLIEAARIARGNIKPLSEYQVDEFDALVFPGGFGVAKNLCTYAIDGASFTVLPQIEQVVKDTHEKGKPIAAMCISPVLIAKLIPQAQLTIGNDKATADVIQNLGATHVETAKKEIAVDKKNKIISTPCYMIDSSVYEVYKGAETLMKELITMM